MLFGKDLYAQVPLGDFPAPALPSLSPQVWKAAFIHSSKNLHAVPRSKFSYSEDFVDNERLEYVGDALLYAIVANYLFRTYPKLRVSYLSSIRQRLVQNVTLAKFAKMYKMDQALELGPGFEKLRSDGKTQADTFEAFVGAVAQVHGMHVCTKWIEELIRPYAAQLYEHHANTYGEETHPEIPGAAASISGDAEQQKKKSSRSMLCGFIPSLSFFWKSGNAEETKRIAGSENSAEGTSGSSNSGNYGTLVSFAQVQDSVKSGGYTRLPDGEAGASNSRPSSSHGRNEGSSKPLSSAMKKTKSTEGESNKIESPALKKAKSRERLAFTPPSVSNAEALKAGSKAGAAAAPAVAAPTVQAPAPVLSNAQTSVTQQAQAPHASNSPKPAVVPSAQPVIATQTKVNGNHGTPAKMQTHPQQQQREANGPVSKNNVTSGNGSQVHSQQQKESNEAVSKNTTTSSGNDIQVQSQQHKKAETPVGVANSSAAPDLLPMSSKPKEEKSTGQKTILQPQSKQAQATSAASAHASAATNGISSGKTETSTDTSVKEATVSERVSHLPPAVQAYLKTITAARADPVAYLESHAMFTNPKNKVRKEIAYDDQGSTATKAIARVKINGQLVAQSAAAAGDEKLAKMRAAWKVIEILHLLPDKPDGEASDSEQKKAPEAAPEATKLPLPTKAPETTAAPATPAAMPAKARPAMASRISTTPATPSFQGSKKPNPIALSFDGPFPTAIYSSLPTPGKENNPNARYFVTSVKGFSSGTYYGILNQDWQLIGQAHSLKKQTAIAEADELARSNSSKGTTKGCEKTKWKFSNIALPSSDPETLPTFTNIKLLPGSQKAATGPIPLLTHALGVSNESEPARLTWLEWYSEDKKVWKSAVFVDSVFVAGGKNAERKVAMTEASGKAYEVLERQAA